MLIEEFIMETIEYKFTAELYPKDRVTLLHGMYGSGKSYSVIKSLNMVGIKPLYVNLDATGGLSSLDFYNLSYDFLTNHKKIKDIPSNPVLVIDTFTRMSEYYNDDSKLVKAIEALSPKFTVIVIGHTADFVGKDGIFRDSPLLARNSSETLWLEKVEYKKTKDKPQRTEYSLHINKGRGNGGSRIIQNWMRD